MKVVLVYLGRKGGGPPYSLEIAKKLSTKVQLLAVVSEYMENIHLWEEAGIQMYKVKTYTTFGGFVLSLFNLANFISLKNAVSQFSPDVIYYPFFHLWLPLISKWFKRKPQVYTSHDPVLHSGENGVVYSYLQTLLLKRSKRVIILSSSFKEQLIKKGIEQDRIDVIPHGIFDYYGNLKAVKRQSHEPRILFFGRLVKYKGLDVLLESFSLIEKEIPNVKLRIVCNGDIKPYTRALKLSDGIELIHAWVPDHEVAQHFIESDILVCPYKDASQSGAIPVAYALKIPVVATKVGGLVEQVEDGVTGLLVPTNDPISLSVSCVTLLKNSELRKKMGEAGYLKATREWNWDIITGQVFNSLNKAVKNI